MKPSKVKNIPKVTQLVINQHQGCPYLILPLPLALLRVTHLQCLWEIFLLHSEQGKCFLRALGWSPRVGRASSLFAVIDFTIFPPHTLLFPLHLHPAAHFGIFKYLRTVSCLQALWSLGREERIPIQINRFHLPGRLLCWGTGFTGGLLTLVPRITATVIQSRNCKIFNVFDQKCMKS